MDEPKTFTERFNACTSDVSETDLASLMGLSVSAVRKVRSGEIQSLKLDAALRLCKRFGIDPYVLAFGGPTPPMTVGVGADLSGMESRLMALIQQNSREIAEVAERQAKAAEELRQRLDALESARPGRGRKAG